MKTLTAALALACAFGACAYNFDENALEPVKKLSKEEIAKLTPAQLEEYKAGRRLSAIHRNGGIIWLQGKGKMLVSLVNGATDEKAVAALVGQVKTLEVDVEVAKTALPEGHSFGELSTEMSRRNAQLAVFVVNRPDWPLMLSAPDEGWTAVNFAKLSADNPNEVRLALRRQKSLARAFMMAIGSFSDQDMTSPLKPANSLAQLDKIPVTKISFWNLLAVLDYMKGMGVTPRRMTTYKRAAAEGIAPAPTNRWQQAIWDQVHAVPKNPMKIEFDPKKGR